MTEGSSNCGIDQIYLVPPRLIPAEAEVAAWIGENGHYLAPPPGAGRVQTLTNETAERECQRRIATIPWQVTVESGVIGQPDDMAHDAYFLVQRVESDAVRVFVRMGIVARIALLKEVSAAPVRIGTDLLSGMDRALADLSTCLSGGEAGSAHADYVTTWQTSGKKPDAMRRWIRGHQVFAALTQGLVFSFQAMGNAMRGGRYDRVHKWAELSVSLLAGSGAAFVFTGDFSNEEYNTIVRPSMSPPMSPICLSGLMSADHRFFVQTLRDMKPVLRALHERERELHRRIQEEISVVYDRHIHVCERFVGKRPSLLTAGKTDKSGPELIEQFKKARIKSFETTAHTSRLPSHAAEKLGASCPHSEKRRSFESNTDRK